MTNKTPTFIATLAFFISFAGLTGCSSIISSATNTMASNLSKAIINSDDLETIKTGAPAYLLLLDSFIEGDPDSINTLVSAASLYTAYANVFVTDEARSKRLTQKALNFALEASCLKLAQSCDLQKMKFNEFEKIIPQFGKNDIKLLFTLGSSWAGWIQSRSSDWQAAAQISRVAKIMQHVVKLDEKYKYGEAHLYLGVLNTLLPAALGGKPEIGKQHFEKAITLSSGKNLMAKVLYAEKYARLVFDQQLHDTLLNDVLKTNPRIRNFTLTNTLAQQQAQTLLTSGKDYF